MGRGVRTCIKNLSIEPPFAKHHDPKCIIVVDSERNMILTDEVAPYRMHTAHNAIRLLQKAYMHCLSTFSVVESHV